MFKILTKKYCIKKKKFKIAETFICLIHVRVIKTSIKKVYATDPRWEMESDWPVSGTGTTFWGYAFPEALHYSDFLKTNSKRVTHVY